MAVIELAQNTSRLSISPWFDEGYVFKSLTMTEQVGDKIASGTVVMTADGTEKSLKLINTENTITINYEQKVDSKCLVTYDIVGYIYARKLLGNELHLQFIAIPNKEFSTESVVREFKDMSIDEILSDIYPGELKLFTKDDQFLQPDIKGKLDKLDQNGLTRLDFCYRLLRSYRKDTVYGLGLEGLFIKDLTRDPEVIYGESDCTPIDMTTISYFKEMELESLAKESSVNIQPRMYGAKYAMVRKDFHSELLDIYQYNSRYLTSLNCRLRLRFITRIPKFKIGDLVIYDNKYSFNQDKRYVVTWIKLDIEFNKIEFDCELSSWEEVKI